MRGLLWVLIYRSRCFKRWIYYQPFIIQKNRIISRYSDDVMLDGCATFTRFMQSLALLVPVRGGAIIAIGASPSSQTSYYPGGTVLESYRL